jgi:hypothetical protein
MAVAPADQSAVTSQELQAAVRASLGPKN